MNQRDLELLSSYLDGQLTPSDSTRLEARLKTDPQLASVLSDLRAARTLLRKLPQRRAPRNFTLTRKMVGQNPPMPRAYPIFRFATALATLLFVFSFGANSLARQLAAPAFGMGGGDASDQSMESFAAEAPPATEAPAEAPALQAPAPAATQLPAEPSANLAPAPTATAPLEDAARIVEETPMTKVGDAGGAEGQDQFQGQSEARWVSSAWQIALAAVAILSALLMFVLRRAALSRWR